MQEEEIESLKRKTHILEVKRDGKEYNSSIRMVYYGLFESRFACGNATPVVKKVLSNLVPDMECNRLPSISSVCNYSREFGIISALQTAALLYNNKACTIGWDATTVRGKHMNEVHFLISTEDGPVEYLITIDRVSGGRAYDYANQILRAIEKSAKLYADFINADDISILQVMYNNISCSMTDRCATNGAVLRNLEARLDKSILMLNCAVHPLDGMCHAMRRMLLQHDKSNKINGMSLYHNNN